ncbi:MAG: hypothetical protein WC997_08525 [Porticoccaceae bacterium]
MSGQVRNDIFDYGRGVRDGAISVGTGLVNFGEQVLRTGTIEANNESKAMDSALNVYVTNKNVRSQVNRSVYNRATDLNNYSPYNIGKLVGRFITGTLTRPVGVVAGIGDGAAALEKGHDFVVGVIYGSER